MKAFWILTAVQLLICLVLETGDIGFDHPGKFGLDFGHLLLLLYLQAVLWLAGLVIALWRKRWGLLLVALATMILTLAIIALH